MNRNVSQQEIRRTYTDMYAWAKNESTLDRDLFAAIPSISSDHVAMMGLIDGAAGRPKDISRGILKNVDKYYTLTSEDIVLTSEYIRLNGDHTRADELLNFFRKRLTKRDIEESRRFCEDSKLKFKPFPKIKT